jgi:hypothetical protein
MTKERDQVARVCDHRENRDRELSDAWPNNLSCGYFSSTASTRITVTLRNPSTVTICRTVLRVSKQIEDNEISRIVGIAAKIENTIYQKAGNVVWMS